MPLTVSATMPSANYATGTLGSVPKSPWLRVAVLSLLFWLGLIGGLEAYWRNQGHLPNVPDTRDLWYFWRERVYHDNGKVIVLLGTSRIKADISLGALERELDMPAVQLGIDSGKSPIGILRNLAADQHFKGIVLCSLFVPLIDRSRWDDCGEFLTYRPARFCRYAENILSLQAHSQLATLSANLSVRALVEDRTKSAGLLPPPQPFAYGFDRSLRMWPDRAVPDSHEAGRRREQFMGWRIPKFDQLMNSCADVDTFVREIRSRGGGVMFIHLPSSGEQLADEQKAFPKAEYWDRFAKCVSAPCLDFQDSPTLRTYSCPDGVHLADQDRLPFTKDLAKEIKRVGFGARAVARSQSRRGT